ncbi:MAG: hypothetical protein K0Q90_3178 [Paenibacillaceae bacterium]|nr:hypothetical protein [Paenibacillaceae bacterium]
MQLGERIKNVILRNMDYEAAIKIGPETNLMRDLELDSIRMAYLLADLEEEFHMIIGMDEISPAMLTRFQHLEDYVRLKTAPELQPEGKEGSFG